MANNIIHSEFLDRYLKNKLSEAERMAFEEKARQDPLLGSELNFQKDIYKALGEARKNALKSRLNQIPVNEIGWYNGYSIKIAAAVSSVLILATGTYFYFNHTAEEDLLSGVVNIESNITPDDHLHQENLSVPVPKKDELEQATVETFAVEKKKNIQNEIVTIPAEKKTEAGEKNNSKALLPDITRPELVTDFEEETQGVNYKDFEIPAEKMMEHTLYENAGLDVENIVHHQYNFHYQMIEHKLYLYGNFQDTPYKIIALNFDEGKKLFLEYNEHFYRLNNKQQEIASLQAIEDSVLLKELKKISTKK